MHLPSPIVSRLNESFIRYRVGELESDNPLYEVIDVAHCYYAGSSDLAKAMLFRDIERNYEKHGCYESSFSYKRYACCVRAKDKTGLCKMVAKMIASLARSEYVKLDLA